MKFLKYLSVVFFFGISFAADNTENLSENQSDIYNCINFESEPGLDICSINKIQKTVYKIADFFWRFLGYDANSYILAKQNLENCDRRFEIILSLLLIFKYPSIYNIHDGMKNIEIEIREGGICHFDNNLYDYFSLIARSKTLADVFENIRSLSDYERYAIAKNIIERERFLPLNNNFGRFQIYFTQVEHCFKPLLQNYLEL